MSRSPPPEFQTSLLREKFTLRDMRDTTGEAPVIALSNRVVLTLPVRNKGDIPETLIVRTQNMHSCIRLAARLVAAAEEGGPPLPLRVPPFDWARTWDGVIEGYERKYNPRIWAAIYRAGKPVFEEGNHHPFLDIIETCDFKAKAEYAASVMLAENAFRKAGREVSIEHDSNTALVLNVTPEQGKVGVIMRGASQTATFNFTARAKRGRPIKIPSCMTVAAAFLEGIQLAFQVGMGRVKLRYGLIDHKSDDAKKLDDSEKRMARLKVAISQFEQLADMTYRPERPDFFAMMDEAQEEAKKILNPQIEDLIRQGIIDGEDWVV